jgi:hypothetical protein
VTPFPRRFPRRYAKEWHDTITYIIRQHGGSACYDDFYREIPLILQLNEWELRPSGVKQESIWRGTLRGYLSHMVKKGILSRSYTERGPIFRLANP